MTISAQVHPLSRGQLFIVHVEGAVPSIDHLFHPGVLLPACVFDPKSPLFPFINTQLTSLHASPPFSWVRRGWGPETEVQGNYVAPFIRMVADVVFVIEHLHSLRGLQGQ